MPKQIKIIIWIVIIYSVVAICQMFYKNVTTFYNTEKTFNLEYTQLTQDQLTTFDNNYLIFKDKSNITNLNKETFVYITKIIMSNRKDGMNLSWKWVHENQNIDYNEFTKFYSDLSNFTLERYKENNSIERKKQEIAKQHNFLIQTFPGIIYNHFFKFKELEYKEGFITEETKLLFNK